MPVVGVTASGYNPNGENRVTISVDGVVVLDESFGADFSAQVRAGSGYVSHNATVVVTALDEPTLLEFPLYSPPCKERIVIAPRARFIGPCEDPMYAAVFDNRDSNRSVTFRWYRRDDGILRVVVRSVSAGHVARSAFRHVDGGSIMNITGHGEILRVKKAAPAGNYADCPR